MNVALHLPAGMDPLDRAIVQHYVEVAGRAAVLVLAESGQRLTERRVQTLLQSLVPAVLELVQRPDAADHGRAGLEALAEQLGERLSVC